MQCNTLGSVGEYNKPDAAAALAEPNEIGIFSLRSVSSFCQSPLFVIK
jgi:hypothetical protein